MRVAPGGLPLLLAACWLSGTPAALALNVQRLDPPERQRLQDILAALDPRLKPRQQDGTAVLLTWEQLYEPLDPSQRAFLDEFRALRGEALGATSHYFGEPAEVLDLAPVGPQPVRKGDTTTTLDPQYLPRGALAAYQRMMDAMHSALGKRLLVESGYRSPAYQLYLFLFYLPKHDSSITETNRFVALPGHSEHGNPGRQAIDFINEEGINGEDHPEAFEALPEYLWLQAHATEFGFFLSYPRDNPDHTAFEPWHWHYTSRAETTHE